MTDFEIRADSVDVQEVMEQIRARIREKRGVDYTEQEIRELAAVKLEKFLDPRAIRSDVLQQFRARTIVLPFGPDPLFTARRPIVARIRRLLRPVLRLFFNPDPITQAFARLNQIASTDPYFELVHNLVIELTRTTIAVKNLQMRVESLTGRVEFAERRARALENLVVYRQVPSEPDSPGRSAEKAPPGEGPGQRSQRLRRRRGRRGRESAAAIMGTSPSEKPGVPDTSADGQADSSSRVGHIEDGTNTLQRTPFRPKISHRSPPKIVPT